MNIKDLYEKYANIDIGDLSNNQKDSMYSILGKAQPEDLHTIEEHKMYIEVLQKLRMASIKDMERVGTKFLDTLKSLLAVGEDGVYSNSQRFIYELIQNVDDCEYESVDDCQLDIQFDYNSSPGKIVLTYNERGFKPENVFAITGIAEKSKNISADKVEIGEKGIGFKSVFGIADKVHIESGSFSFELYRDNFTVPIPRYDNFKPIKGTRLTLEMPIMTVKKVYQSMVEQYMKGDAALNQNPILFLNKLTHLKMYFDSWRYIVFDVERKQPEYVDGDIAFENDVIISVDMKDSNNGIDKSYSSVISCKRYTQPIIYGEQECKSRYGEDAPFTERRHNLIIIFPDISDDLKDFKGVMYSFLPTQIHIAAPVVMHVPFKLDGSREFVDPQGENLWFSFTANHLADFLKLTYIHLATIVKQDIITYIPNRHNFFFKKTNEKIQCLQKNELKGDTICKEPVFYTTDGSFENVDNIIAFGKDENLENPEEVFGLLGESNKLFIPNKNIDMQWYGAKVIVNAPALLFKRGLREEKNFGDIAKILDSIGKDLNYVKLIEECCPLVLTKVHLLVMNAHRPIYTAFNTYAGNCLSDKKLPRFSFDETIPVKDESFGNEIQELITSADLNTLFEKYLKHISFKFYVLEGIKAEFAVAGSNGIVIAEGSPMGSFSSLVSKYDPRKVFAATLQIRQASDKLNDADESMTDSEYLKLLRSVRVSLKNAFGTRMYNSYIQIINQAGMDKNRFLNELLQNADDCKYSEGELPEFNLRISGNTITVSYNELGFTKQNVRAITAIGESTKKLLLDGNDHSIGEKGVGFKSVFGVAESVEIHSNDFDFKLTDKMPTVPDKCEPLVGEKKTGTTLVFSMKTDVCQAFKEEKIIKLCLCLRNLKRIDIQGTRVIISDSEDERTISIGEKLYSFEKFVYDFDIEDEKAIAERSTNQKVISKNQRIYCYIPKDYRMEKYPLYVGLPTIVDCNIPLIIDAPFELTTSRDNVVQCRWNEIVRDTIYDALFELMYEKREKLRIDIFKFVKFVSLNNTSYYQTFSDGYLNSFKWIERLKEEELLPVLNTETEFVSADEEDCLIVPEVIAFISKKHQIGDEYEGTIIDTYHKSQYIPFLEHIGCRKSRVDTDLKCIQMVVSDMITDEKFREALYGYLTLPATQSRIRDNHYYGKVKELPIFPIRTRSGIEYVAYSKKIYTHETKKSDNDFQILETKIMTYDVLQTILGGTERVNELSQEIYEARYQNNLVAYIQDKEKSDKEKALYVLNEFKNNRINFQRCQATLKGMLEDIPMEMISGNYQVGNKFVNKKGLIFSGKTIKEFIVTDLFKPLAEYLGCTDVLEIHYDDIDLNLERISDEDIDDFQSEFTYYVEILGGFIKDGIITDEQIAKFNLEYLSVGNDMDEDNYEEFPGHAVANLQKLQKHIRDQFRTNPNPYVERQRIVHEPKNPVNKETYTVSMYGSVYNSQKCFCQMCQRIVPKSYIERNDIQREPKYGWDQMYLSLCLNCSKDYILLRNNKSVWDKFINNILDVDVEDDETLLVEIGNKTLAFTATHLAEIQTIFEIEKEEEE